LDTLIILLSYILVVMGIVGIIIPGLPGLIFILAGILVYGWHFGFEVLGYNFIATMVLLTVIGTVVDILGSMVGAKKYGASKLSILAIVVGVIIGAMAMGPIGLIIGPIVAVILTEMFRGKSFSEAIKVTLGVILGFISGLALRFVIGIGMAIAFTIKLILIHIF